MQFARPDQFIWSVAVALSVATLPMACDARETFPYRNVPTRIALVSESSAGDDVLVERITYSSPVRGRVPAILVRPVSSGRHPAIIFLHWGFGNETEFRSEAIGLARRGVISLLVSAPWARPAPWTHVGEGHFSQPSIDIDLYVQTVADVREGVDLLERRSDVDGQRLGFVGHSYGATWGGPILGTEPRFKAGVLIAGLPTLSDFSPRFSQGAYMLEDYNRQILATFSREQVRRFSQELAPLAPERWIGRSKAAILLQFAKLDQFISPTAAREYSAASPVAESKTYECVEHRMDSPEVVNDRIAFLAEHLGFDP